MMINNRAFGSFDQILHSCCMGKSYRKSRIFQREDHRRNNPSERFGRHVMKTPAEKQNISATSSPSDLDAARSAVTRRFRYLDA